MTENLASHWSSGRLASVKPNVILIMLGTNDIGQGIDVDNAPARLTNYIEQIFDLAVDGNPSAFVGSIPPGKHFEHLIAVGTAEVAWFSGPAANELSLLVKQLGSQQTTVLMATHDLYRAKEVSSHIGIMRQGRLVETVKPSDVSHTELEAIALRSMQF